MQDFIIRRDIPVDRPNIADIYGEVIKNLEPGDSLLIKSGDRKNLLMYVRRKFGWTREFSSLTYEGSIYLQRVK